MKKIILSIAAAVISAVSFAQGPEILLIPDNAASTAMGGVQKAVETHSNSFGIGLNYKMWAPKAMNIAQYGLTTHFRLSKSLEASIEGGMFNGQTYEISDENGAYNGTFSPKSIAARAGIAYKLESGLAFGVKASFVNSALAKDNSSNAFGVDVGAQYNKDNISAGVSVCNLASPVALGKVDFIYSISGLKAGAEIDYLFKGGLMAGIGAEYTFIDMISIRAGFHYGADKAIPTYASAGLGLHFGKFKLDGSYIIYNAPLAGTIAGTIALEF